jgi:hypothetical protein
VSTHRERAERFTKVQFGQVVPQWTDSLAAEFEAVEAPLLARIAALEASAEAVLEPLCIALAGDNTQDTRERVAEGYRKLRDCMADDDTTALKALLVRAVEEAFNTIDVDDTPEAIAERILKEGR